MKLEEIKTCEQKEEIAERLCEAYMIIVKVLDPIRSRVCINNDNAHLHPMQTIKVLMPIAKPYMTDALRAKIKELTDGIPEEIDREFRNDYNMWKKFSCEIPWYACRPEYTLENYEKEYENK